MPSMLRPDSGVHFIAITSGKGGGDMLAEQLETDVITRLPLAKR